MVCYLENLNLNKAIKELNNIMSIHKTIGCCESISSKQKTKISQR